MVVFRCDGDERVGAGHVARCLQIARAFSAAGTETVFAGRYAGVAAALLEQAGAATVEPVDERPAGVPAEAEAAVVDSYALSVFEVGRAAQALPLAVISDGGPALPGTTVLSYHLDAAEGDVLGPDYAPVDPRYVTARRPRGLERVLVTLGGSSAAASVAPEAEAAAGELEGVRVESGAGATGLVEMTARADAAISAAGFTPYELACAGVPMVLVALAENQAPVAEGFDRHGLAVGARAGSLAKGVRRLADPELRAELSAAGPATIDGLGAFRARDALAAAFAGRGLPAVLRLRPVRPEDSQLLLAWRNDPEVRAVSRREAEVTAPEHEAWLADALADPLRMLFVVEAGGEPAGTVRFDLGEKAAELSVTVAPGRRGSGLGTAIVRQASELLLAARPDLGEVLAEVRPHNRRSTAAFESAGFRPAAGRVSEGSLVLVLDRRGLASAP